VRSDLSLLIVKAPPQGFERCHKGGAADGCTQ
jgi:hypothetical protein